MQKKSLRLGLILFLFIVSIISIDAAVLFESDWSTSLGTGSSALNDGGIWTSGPVGSGGVMEVVSASGLDFPEGMINVLSIDQDVTASFHRVSVAGVWALPSVGEWIYRRIYWRNNALSAYTGSDPGEFNHPVQSCLQGGSKCGDLWWRHNYPGGSTWKLQLTTNDVPYPENHHSPGSVFTYDTTYRIEWGMKRISTTTWELHVKVYDSADTLIYGDSDFKNSENSGTLADLPIITTNDPTSQTEWLVGFQGDKGSDNPNEYIYFGGFAVCDTDWCGAYNSTINDTTPPTRSISSPSVNLSAGTTSTSISLTTNEAATCKYGTIANTAYSSMANTFSTTGSTSHSQLITGLSDGNNYNYYVRCQDSLSNANTNDFTISFGVSAPAVCGDNICNGAETCSTCSQDCGTCPSSGLVASYDFNEGTGSSLTDRSGNSHAGTVIGATWTTGKFGGALSFDGVNDYVNIPDDTQLDITGDITLMAWVNTPGGGFDNIIVKGVLGSAYALFLNSLGLEYNLGTYSGSTGESIPADTWTHVALTYDGSNIRIYRNSAEVVTVPSFGSLGTNAGDLQIGAAQGTSPFIGKIDDVRIYNQALSQAEIQGDMNTPVGAFNQRTFTYNWSNWYTNETTNFAIYTDAQLQDLSDVKFANQHGTINFLERLNLSKLIYDLRNRIRVFSHKIWVNSSLIPEFNKSAQLTFKGVAYTNPIIKIDGVDCPATVCQNISFNEATGDYVFNVTAFSVFEVVEQCEDGVKNYDETGVDCGGSCGECSGGVTWIWVVVGAIVLIGFVVFIEKKKRKPGSRKKRK